MSRATNKGFMDLNIKLLFHQGLWPEEPDGDLEYYLQYYSPWLTGLIVRYRYVRLALQMQRYLTPRVLMLYMATHVFVIHPVDIYFNFEDKMGIVENCYVMCVFLYNLVAIVVTFLNKTKLKSLINECGNLSQTNEGVDEKHLREMNNFLLNCFRVIFYFDLNFIFFVAIAMIVLTIFETIPNRCLFTRGWLPYNLVASPNFELTFATEVIFCLMHAVIAPSVITIFLLFTLSLGIHFKILCQRLRNMRQRTIAKMQGNLLARNSVIGLSINHGLSACCSFGNENDIIQEGVRLMAKPQPSLMKTDTLIQKDGLRGRDVLINITERECPACGDDVNKTSERYGLQHRELKHSLRAGVGQISRRARNVRPKICEGEVTETFKNIDIDKLEELRDNSDQLNMEMLLELHSCIETHTTLLNGTVDFTSMLSNWIMVAMVCNIIGAGGTALLVLDVHDTTFKELMFLTVYGCIVITTFLLNYISNWISDQSLEVGEAMYACDWLGTSKSFKRSMLIVMSWANIPLEFKPTWMDPLSVQQFGEVSIQAYKMFATLNSLVK